MTGHEWEDCPNTPRIVGLERRMGKCEGDVEGLRDIEARREGGQAMLKYILGSSISGLLLAIVGLIVTIALK